MSGFIEILGARTNNLQSLDVKFSLNQATMVVGVSGSGKSSLLADTLATEANSRMRRFLGVGQLHLGEENVPAFVGPVPPCIHFSQGAFRASSRTTVATSSGLLALLRSYFRQYAQPWCEELRTWVLPPSSQRYGKWIQNNYTGALSIWSVVTRWERSDGIRAAQQLRNGGVRWAMIRSESDSSTTDEQGRRVDLEHFRPLSGKFKHLIESSIAQLELPKDGDKLQPLLEKAFSIGGDVIVEFHHGHSLPAQLHGKRGILLDSHQHWVHPDSPLPYAPPSDALVSFNSPSNPEGGACPTCSGLGQARTVDVSALVNRPHLSLHEGALTLWTEKNYRHVNIQHATLEGLRGINGFDPHVPWRKLSEEAKQLILFGTDQEIIDIDPKTGKRISSSRGFHGFVPAILRRFTGPSAPPRELVNLISEGRCSACEGTRWSREARSLRLGNLSLPLILRTSFDELRQLVALGGFWEQGLPEKAHSMAERLFITAGAFVSAGLGHLSGERGMTTLSEGESRRSRLATVLRAGGNGLGLLLDEPARGLHEADIARLAKALADIKQHHTLIFNEHRFSLAGIADQILEIGPGSGAQGGRLVSTMSPSQFFQCAKAPLLERTPNHQKVQSSWVSVKGANIHTLDNLNCKIPLGRWVCITGVSGSGKSSFVRGILLPSLMHALPGKVDCEELVLNGGHWEQITGAEQIDKVLVLAQGNSTTQRRSSVATLLGLANDLRKIFGNSKEAKKANLRPSDFGWNAGNGRCQTCLGLGEIQDLDQWVPCPHCGGSRFGPEVLAIKVEGLHLGHLLELPVTDLINHRFIQKTGWQPVLQQLIDLDLGYLNLGRRVDRLSGGEHQRLRIARTLSGQKPKGLFLVLDEPSAGLHPMDAAKLFQVLDRMVVQGSNTLVLIEHNIEFIRAADWIIDFGPGGGPEGGRIVGEGSPAEISKLDSPTGKALRNQFVQIPPLQTKARRKKTDTQTISIKSATLGRAWLKRLLGQESLSPEMDPDDFQGLGAIYENPERSIRPYEIAGLDKEIARLLLDMADAVDLEPDRFARRWSTTPNAKLQIHPLLEELRVWGTRIPGSVLKAASLRLKRMGLKTKVDMLTCSDFSGIRATGTRFDFTGQTFPEKVRLVREALEVGGGYLELSEGGERPLASLAARQVNFEIPAVAPYFPGPFCLLRHHASGGCPSCSGTGHIQTFDETLLIAGPQKDPLAEQFLCPEALQILRGVRRNTLIPFLKRMSQEGLWNTGKPFKQLGPHEKSILLFGYWHRPGSGSFLKSANSNPQMVGSWLRWDGFYREVLLALDRGKARNWTEKIRAATRTIECPICAGTGLQIHAHTLHLGNRSFFEWVRLGTLGAFCSALEQWTPPSVRSLNTQKRVLHCIEPLRLALPEIRLREPVTDPNLMKKVFDRTLKCMTLLKVIE